MRKLEAMMIVTDSNMVEPDDGVAAMGSGGMYASSAAKALARNTQMSAREIVQEAMKIAAYVCIYTNDRVTIDSLPQT